MCLVKRYRRDFVIEDGLPTRPMVMTAGCMCHSVHCNMSCSSKLTMGPWQATWVGTRCSLGCQTVYRPATGQYGTAGTMPKEGGGQEIPRKGARPTAHTTLLDIYHGFCFQGQQTAYKPSTSRPDAACRVLMLRAVC
eukprot:362920-Chlamydomonas_euryale.AAC.4